MFTSSRLGLLGLLIVAPLPGTTLERLSLEEMIAKSTGIARAKVTGSYAAARGTSVYTFYKLEISESLKGAPVPREVAVPGGVLRGMRQTVAGAPILTQGEEYVLFLWTSRTGLTQVIGLSQGLFNVKLDATGKVIAMSAGSEADGGGAPVKFTLPELRSRVQSVLSGGAAE